MELPPSQVCMVRGTLAFVLRLSQIFGVASLKFERFGNGWRIRTSKAVSIYGITFITLLSILTLSQMSLQLFRFLEMPSGNFNSVLAFGVVAAFSAVLSSEIYFKLHRMKHIITCLSEVEKVNVELSQYAVCKSNEQFQRFVTIWTLLGGLILVGMDIVVLFFTTAIQRTTESDTSEHFALYFVFSMVKILNLQLSLIIATVLSSFARLNECLNNLLQQIWKESSEPKIRASLTKSELNRKTSAKSMNILIDSMGAVEDRGAITYDNTNDVILNRLGFLYCILHDVVQQLDNSHGLFLVLLITSHFINLAVSLYYVFKLIMEMQEYYRVILGFLWAMCIATDMLIIIEPSHQTSQQVKRTKHLISQLMLCTPLESHAFNSELNLFYKNLLFNEVSYSPMKMFKLNRTIITVVTGSIITYLVVILQV